MQELTEDSFNGRRRRAVQRGRRHLARNSRRSRRKAGCVVVDNSSAFRMDDTVPLVVPEINAADVKRHKGIIANPNCTTAITLMALYPLHQAFGVKRIFASSYQAVSGTGAQGDRGIASGRSRQLVGRPAGDEGSLSAPDRLQRAAARRFLPADRLHEGRDEDAERRPQDHASSDVPRAASPACACRFTARTPWRSARSLRSRSPSKPRARCCSKAPGLDVVDDPENEEVSAAALRRRERQLPGRAGSAWIARWTTACASGSSAINCSRARR